MPILFLYYEESLVSSNLNSKQLSFHCDHPNLHICIKLFFPQDRKNGHQTRKPDGLSNGNNSPEKDKSPTPPPDLDVSSRRIIPFGPFDKSFSEDPNDYFYFGEQVPPMTLSRSLRKGDILEVAVLSITNPGKKCLCTLDPKNNYLQGCCKV